METSLPEDSQEPVRLVVKHTFLELDAGQVGVEEVPRERRRKSDSSVQKTSGFSQLLDDHRKELDQNDDEEGSAMSGIDSHESRRDSWASQEDARRVRGSVSSIMTSNGWDREDPFASRRNSRASASHPGQRGNKMGLYQDEADEGMMPSASYKTDYGDYGDEYAECPDPSQWAFYTPARGPGCDAGSRVPLATAPNFGSPMPPVYHPGAHGGLPHPPPHPGYHRYPHHPPHPGYGHPGYFPPSYGGYPPPPWGAGYPHPPPAGAFPFPPPPQQQGDPMRPAWLYPPNLGANGSGGSGGGRTRGSAERDRGGDQERSAGSQEARSTDTSFLQSSSAGCRTTYTPTKTTVMLRNIPWGFSRDSLTSLLDKHGFNGLYDFVYMPMNFRSEASFGYAFVNLVSSEAAEKCHDKFNGFTEWGVETDKVCEVSWSDMHQGLAAHIDRYRNSPVMHESVPDAYKPVMYSGGVRAIFPAPTKKIRQPRIRRTAEGGEGGEDDDDLDDGEGGGAERRRAATSGSEAPGAG